jgi:hypothetical protein
MSGIIAGRGALWKASNVFYGEWTPKQEMLYVDVVLAAKIKGWNGVEYGMPPCGGEQGMHGRVYAVFGTNTDRMEQIIELPT